MPIALFAEAWTLTSIAEAALASMLFGILGIVLLALGFKVFEWITPKLHIEEELAKGNMAVAVVGASALIGISLVALRAISG